MLLPMRRNHEKLRAAPGGFSSLKRRSKPHSYSPLHKARIGVANNIVLEKSRPGLQLVAMRRALITDASGSSQLRSRCADEATLLAAIGSAVMD
jgi:hypothetical protein